MNTWFLDSELSTCFTPEVFWLRFDLMCVSISTNSLISAGASDLVLFHIMKGHSRLRWNSSSPYTV